MQEREDDILKSMFQKEFNTRLEQVEEENWDVIAAKLDGKRFYKFSYTRFNVFYLTAIIISFVVSILSILHWILPNDASSSLNNTKDTLQILPSEKKQSDQQITPTEKNITSASSSRNFAAGISQITKDTLTDTKSSLTAADSNLTTTSIPKISSPDTASVLPKEKTKPVVRKVIYRIKQDTLIKVDTVRATSKRKKK